MNRLIRKGDCVLIIDEQENHYLEIGLINDIEYDSDGAIEYYEVIFKTGLIHYSGWSFQAICKILLFSDR